MFIYDRMYGELKFPPLIKKVLDCPGLLRLREVRMANIPFFSFPSFTAVTRFEHSLGVAHLARLFSESIGLSDQERHEIMLAALYHDVATPPFGHLVEEVLNARYGFDHEKKLCDLIIGVPDEYGGQRAQVFLGKSLKIHKICQSKEGNKLGLNPYRIADLTTGDLDSIYGDIIASKGIDLDNIDNVIRAATAMGVTSAPPTICEALATSFMEQNGALCIQESSRFYAYQWQQAREDLYSKLFSSLCDFALQTMLKDAIQALFSNSLHSLKRQDWCLTDEQLIFERLNQNPESEKIVKRMRLMQLYQSLVLFSVEIKPPSKLSTEVMDKIKDAAFEIYKTELSEGGGTRKPPEPSNFVVNFYLDKRKRSIKRSFTSYGQVLQDGASAEATVKFIIGVFSKQQIAWNERCSENLVEIMTSKVKNFSRCVRVKSLI